MATNSSIYARFSGGNVKLGNMGSFSKLYGNDTFSTRYGMVCGSCGNHCIGCKHACYVRKSYRYGSVINAHARNTLAFRINLENAFSELDGQLSRKRKAWDVVRINQSGEIESVSELLSWIRLARKHPESKFYIYTKNFDAVEYVAETDIIVPDNFTLLISIWHEYGINEFKKYKSLSWVKAFVYMDGFDYETHGIKVETLCHAYDENGKLDHNITCDKCKKCIHSIFKVIGCYEH